MNGHHGNTHPWQRHGYLWTILMGLLVALGNATYGDSGSKAAKEMSSAFSAAATSAMPAVVSISVEKTVEAGPMAFGSPFGFNDPFGPFDDDLLRQFFGDRMPPRQRSPQKFFQHGQGSGFIISRDGYILTNNHVVGDVDKITVELKDGRRFDKAKLIGTDPDSEVALVKIEGEDFPVLPLGDSSQIAIGDWVIAIGNPFSLNETVTVGVISAVGRSNVHIAAYEDFIQTDAAINPGNSGGPLIDLDGKVIGINTAIMSESGGYMGIGFAIPINMARTIEEQLKTSGKVTRGYVGLYGQDVTPDMADLLKLKDRHGVIVASVEKGSPAGKAGVESHDIILAVNGKRIESYDAFRNEIAMLKPGSRITLQILRDGKTLEAEVALGERPSGKAPAQPKERQHSQATLGIEVQNLTKDLADQFGYALGEGVIVSSVVPGSSAAEAGIQPGDLVQSVNRQSIASADEFERAIKAAKDKKVLLLVKRGETSQFVVVPFTE